MRGGPKRRTGVCCAIVLVAIAGCRQIVDFDEPSLPLPFVPFMPAPEHGETCASCAAEKCSAQHQACVDDPQCRELLRCHGACSDPLCIARCGSYDLLDYTWGAGSAWTAGRRGAEDARFSDHQFCVSQECSDDCGWGLDWGCVDKSNRYRWPSEPHAESSPLHVKLEVLLAQNAGVPADVSAFFPSGTGMDVLLQASETNAWGQVDLEFPFVADPILQIESQNDAADEFRVLDYSGPFFRDTRLSRSVFPSDFRPVSPHEGFAGVLIAVRDCIGAPASGIAFELEGAKGKLYKFDGMGGFADVDTRTDWLGAGGFEDVSPADATVTVRAKRGAQIVARRKVLLRKNWVTSVVLRPLSGDE
jgi:hypothetical protein